MLVLLSASSGAADLEQDLLGHWQHQDLPVIVEMKSNQTHMDGIVVSNSDKPDSVGKRVFRDIESIGAGEWQGKIYVLKLESEKDVSIVLLSADQFEITVKVGFFSKKVKWNRVSELKVSSD